jgi:hypothetical protein
MKPLADGRAIEPAPGATGISSILINIRLATLPLSFDLV